MLLTIRPRPAAVSCGCHGCAFVLSSTAMVLKPHYSDGSQVSVLHSQLASQSSELDSLKRQRDELAAELEATLHTCTQTGACMHARSFSYTHVHTYAHRHVRMHARTHAPSHPLTCTPTHTRTHMCVHTCTHRRACACTHLCMTTARMHTRVHARARMHAFIHACTGGARCRRTEAVGG